MPWFKVDDGLAFHAKTLLAGNAAMGLWVRAGAWSSQNLTSGHIPTHVARQLGSKREADRLVSSRLWDTADDGYQFHQWGERNPLRDDVIEQRRKNAQKLAEWRRKKGEKDV